MDASVLPVWVLEKQIRTIVSASSLASLLPISLPISSERDKLSSRDIGPKF